MSSNPALAFYDRISRVYDLIADAGEHKARRRGLELLRPAAGDALLEIGFGTGHALVELARAVGQTGGVSGIDISSGMLSVAGKRLERTALRDRVRLLTREVPPLPYGNASFDGVFMSFTLELFPDEGIGELLAEIRRVLQPGGRLAIVSMATVQPDEHESSLERGYKWMHRHFPHIVDCRPIDVARHVETAGFTIEKSERIDLFTLPVVALVGR